VRQGRGTEKHTLPTNEKERESEQDKDEQQRRSTHFLQMRRRGKVSETRTSNIGEAPTD
jgi:hypothetical protein